MDAGVETNSGRDELEADETLQRLGLQKASLVDGKREGNGVW